MMTLLSPPPSALSSPQRRCHLLLMLYSPDHTVTPETVGRVNGVDDMIARQDIAETAEEIQRFHRVTIITQQDGSYRIEGSALDSRLCLFHWLRRALRLCPQFVASQFTPALKSELKRHKIAKAMYDDTNLHALVNLCSRRLDRHFDARDVQFLQLYLQFCLSQYLQGQTPLFSSAQRDWAIGRAEFNATSEILRHWQRRVAVAPHENEHLFLTLLFMMLRTPDPQRDDHHHDLALREAIYDVIHRFRELSGMAFSDENGLAAQLYIHLAQALNRSLYCIGIDNSLPEEIHRLYPRLMRTTSQAFTVFEQRFGIHFSEEEMGLVAVIFGAWLMQETELHEKQVLLLTGNDSALEQEIEQQLRELTLLPLNIKYLTLHTFQKEGAPKEVTLIITPYPTALPLFSPPIIHASLPLGEKQQGRIRAILEG